MRIPAHILAWLVALLALGWCALALGYTLPGPPLAAKLAAGMAATAGLLALRVLGVARGLAVVAAIVAVVVVWFLSLVPPQDAPWQPDVARLPRATLQGDRLTIENVRNFDYRSETDFTPRWETRSYDLAKIDGVDLFLSHWSGPAIAHTILSWSFADGQHLAISIETRKRVGQEYSAIGGFFRQYPIYYVVADERDVIRLRTNHRGEHVWLYRLQPARPGAARAMLLEYVAAIDALAERPAWYDALTQNCTTTIHQHARHLNPGANPLDWRLLANGHLPELLYEQGRIDTSVPFDQLARSANVDARAEAADRDPEFSKQIREPD